jgi:hypothetical protein
MSNKLKDAEAKYNNDLWTLTDHVMHLMGFNHTINPKDASLSNFIFATSRMGNKYGASLTERFREVLWTLEQISWCIRMSITALLMR